MKILGLSGSLRRDSYNTRLLAAAAALAEPAELSIYDYAAVPLYSEDVEGEGRPAAVNDLLAAIAGADALLLATPEYNHSISGVLKNAIDWASRPAFASVLVGKPTAVVSAAMSPIGGARAQQHLKVILASTLTPLYPANEYLLPLAQQAFDQSGALSDEIARDRLRRFMQGFVQWAGSVTGSAD